MSNKMRGAKFMEENQFFRKCCELAKTPITMRQVSKFRMGRGVAFQKKNELIRSNLIEKGVINNGRLQADQIEK